MKENIAVYSNSAEHLGELSIDTVNANAHFEANSREVRFQTLVA
jgi:hypothetical protein